MSSPSPSPETSQVTNSPTPPPPPATTTFTSPPAPTLEQSLNLSPDASPPTTEAPPPPPDTPPPTTESPSPPPETLPVSNTPPSQPPASAPTPTANSLPPTTPPTPTATQNNFVPPSTTLPSPPRSGGMSRGALIGLVIGTVFGSLLFVGVCAFWYKRRKWRKERGYGLHAAPPQQPKADQFGGPPRHWQETIPPATDGGVTLLPKPTPTPGVGSNQQLPSINVPTPPMHHATITSLGSERPYFTPSSAIFLGQSQSTFTYEELAFATNGFSNSNLLGQGGFGYVHKGDLPNGKTVAIKQLRSGSRQGEREFQAEVEVISRVHHRHLVSLVGYCIAGDQRMLVYEFVPNNTLEFHLHGKDRPTMDWPTRMKIAIGSAKGLAYLHEDCQPKIIHRDIKASNILLDENFEAKVADFGLAKFSSDTDTHVSTRVMGTIGYLAPEYAASGKLTDKSDVFSFGVMLLELITGRKPVDKTESFTDDSMVEWARPLLSKALESGNFDALADPRLQKSYNSDEMIRMSACAAACVRHSARRRPRMSQVVRALEGNISLDDLNEGSRPGHSRAFNSFERLSYDTGQHNEDLKKFGKLALEGQEQVTSECSGPSSEYGQQPSASSGSGQQHTQEK